MSLQVATLTRSFRYAGVTLPDPGSSLSPDSVRDLYTAHYPELATATVEGPEQQGGELVYTFKRAVGTKGATPLAKVRAALNSTKPQATQPCSFSESQTDEMHQCYSPLKRLVDAVRYRPYNPASLPPGLVMPILG